ncbi:MAG: M14 family metallopeptidase [Parasphingorhabdus sp.]
MPDGDILSCFSASYAEAREQFLQACDKRSLKVESRLNPNAKGADGEELFTDIVKIGSPVASKALLLISGTHGVEGYSGSAVQTGMLTQDFLASLPADMSVIMVHAMNPYGFSHDRRVNEDNIDLNRNFLDFDAPERPQSDYSNIHGCVLPSDWGGAALEAANTGLMSYIAQHGMPAFQAAVTSGQYQYPDGLFYGGDRPSWSNKTFRSILSQHLTGAASLAVIDFHTGLGPYGYGELITIGSEHQKALAAKCYGDQVTDPEAGTSTSAALDGMLANGISESLPNADISFVTIEFGTRDTSTVLTALRADNWLYQKGDLDSSLGQSIKKDIRDSFYPEEDDWKHSVWSRSCEVIELAMNGLAK